VINNTPRRLHPAVFILGCALLSLLIATILPIWIEWHFYPWLLRHADVSFPSGTSGVIRRTNLWNSLAKFPELLESEGGVDLFMKLSLDHLSIVGIALAVGGGFGGLILLLGRLRIRLPTRYPG
jgi:hypothetical protein